MTYGYARVSTHKQARDGSSLQAQEEQLRAAGAGLVFSEDYTGTKKSRPKLDLLMSELQEGDTVIVTKLDRVARNLHDGIEIVDEIVSRGCGLHVLNMGLFDNTPTGKLMFNILLAFAEFERDMIVTRTSEGKAVKRANDPTYREGRKPKDMRAAGDLLTRQRRGEVTVAECCAVLGCSRSTWYNYTRV